jgi:hypothetical protein
MGNANDYSLESLYQEAWERQRRQKQETFIALNAVEMMPYYIVPGSRKEVDANLFTSSVGKFTWQVFSLLRAHFAYYIRIL